MQIIPGLVRGGLPKYYYDKGLRLGAEIGIRSGANAIKFLKHGLTVICVDHWEEYQSLKNYVDAAHQKRYFVEFKNKTKPYKNTRIIKKMTSMQAVSEIEYESLDFVYLDGNHVFDSVMCDIIRWSKRVRPGGIVSGHDYSDEVPGVKLAVDTYVKVHSVKVFLTELTGKHPNASHSWFFEKDK